jgi:hypothetical protein
MPVSVECDCGKRFKVNDDSKGRKVRCPACQDLVRVPGKADPQEGYGVEQVIKCPQCKAEWPPETVICTNCGWNFRKGKAMKTRYKVGERELARGGTVLFITWIMVAQREEEGDLFLINKYFLWGIPVSTERIKLTGYTEMITDYVAGDGDSPEEYYLDLEGPRKRSLRIYSGSNQEEMHAIIDGLSELARLEVRRR